MKVFLVEDSILVRQRLARMISNIPGIQIVGEALEPRDATRSILETQPEVVILDIQLLNGTGMQVLQNIKRAKAPPIVIILTNFPELRNKYLQAGADFFFDKSTEFHRIPLTLATMIKLASKR